MQPADYFTGQYERSFCRLRLRALSSVSVAAPDRFGVEGSLLLEQEYQRYICGGDLQPREVIYHVEGGRTFTANPASMQLTEETEGHSYSVGPSSLCSTDKGVHKRSSSANTTGASTVEVDSHAAPPPCLVVVQISRCLIQASSSNVGKQCPPPSYCSIRASPATPTSLCLSLLRPHLVYTGWYGAAALQTPRRNLGAAPVRRLRLPRPQEAPQGGSQGSRL